MVTQKVSGRLQKNRKGKLIPKNLEPNGEVFLDGGHNKSTKTKYQNG